MTEESDKKAAIEKFSLFTRQMDLEAGEIEEVVLVLSWLTETERGLIAEKAVELLEHLAVLRSLAERIARAGEK